MVTKTRMLREVRLLLLQLRPIVLLVKLAFVCEPKVGWSGKIRLTWQTRRVFQTWIDYTPPFNRL